MPAETPLAVAPRLPAFEPLPLATLMARMLAEREREHAIFDLPRRSFWRGREDLDLSVGAGGQRASNPAGPAAGPHTQLAQNLVIAWLAGSRALELKTVQILDDIEVPRPCIDAGTIVANVEWSQELSLEQSLGQYLSAWLLIHVLERMGVTGETRPQETRFIASVGYDLAGIRSDRVARFIDGLTGAGPALRRLRDGLPAALRRHAEVEVPERVTSCVTLSTFHGCPPEEIERIAEHLISRHGVHVVLKLNPTLLGLDAVEELLRGRLGYREIRLVPEAFAGDPPWAELLGMLERVGRTAERAGLSLGVKLTNTLVAHNDAGILPGERVYLSGAPLHALAVTLAHRIAEATDGRVPLSFSAGVDAENFADAVACGFAPVTACSDLLQPTGYRRLPRYLKALEAEMDRVGVRTVDAFVVSRAAALRRPASGGAEAARASGDQAAPPSLEAVRAAWRANLADYARRVPEDPRYRAERHRERPRREDRDLALFDCASCNACLVACPNDAFFSFESAPGAVDAGAWVVEAGALRFRSARFEIREGRQWAVEAGLCNSCGNCDTFCPERGGPFRAKPRVFRSLERFTADPGDGFWVEPGGARVRARIEGRIYALERGAGAERFGDGVLEVEIGGAAPRAGGVPEGHELSLDAYHAMRLVRDAVCGRARFAGVP